jgi:hypothetical protein
MENIENISSFFLLTLIIYTIILSLNNIKSIGTYILFALMAAMSLAQLLIAKYLATKSISENIEFSNSLNITIYILLEFLIFTLFFYLETKSNLTKRICIGAFIIIFLLLMFFVIKDNNDIKELQVTFSFFESAVLLTLSTLVFLEIIFDNTILSLSKSPLFIIALSAFFFFGISFPFYVLSFFTKNDHFINVEISIINNIAYIIFYFIIIKGIKCKILMRN